MIQPDLFPGEAPDLGSTFAHLEKRLEADLADAARVTCAPPNPVKTPPVDRTFLIKSALQKAIRRNCYENACLMAYALEAINSNALWSRLCIIALEDVGLANLDAVATTLWVAGRRAWREKTGSQQVLAWVLGALCGSAKDRSGSDIQVLYRRLPDLAGARKSFAGLSDPDLEDIIRGTSRPLAERALAAQYLAGVQDREFRGLLTRRGDRQRLLRVYQDLGCPDLLLYVIKRALAMPTEDMGVCLGLLYQGQQAGPIRILEDGGAIQAIGPYAVSGAFDAHCGEGQQAIRRFLDGNPGFRERLAAMAPGSDAFILTGALIFRAEGQRVQQRHLYPMAESVWRQATAMHLRARGLAEDQQETALALLTEYLPQLNAARHAVYTGLQPARR